LQEESESAYQSAKPIACDTPKTNFHLDQYFANQH